MRLLIACILNIAITCAAWSQATPATAPKPEIKVPDDINYEPDVVFGKGGTQDLHADIAYPKNASKPTPAVIYIHGGGWIGGTYKTGSTGPIFIMAKAGIFGASIEYRLAPKDKWPAQIQDCKLAVRWLRANAAKYNIDPNRIGVWGGSAGGQLVVCLGTMPDRPELEGDGGYPGVSSKVQAVVDFFGPVDFTKPELSTPSGLADYQKLMGMPYEQNPDAWKAASPLYAVSSGTPPTLIFHGDSDKMIPLAQSNALIDALQKAGVPNELVVVQGGTHGFHLNPGQSIHPSWGEINKKIVAFFKQYLAASSTN